MSLRRSACSERVHPGHYVATFVTILELERGWSPDQQGDPLSVASDDLAEEIADRLGGAEGVVLGQQRVEALLVGGGEGVDMEF